MKVGEMVQVSGEPKTVPTTQKELHKYVFLFKTLLKPDNISIV